MFLTDPLGICCIPIFYMRILKSLGVNTKFYWSIHAANNFDAVTLITYHALALHSGGSSRSIKLNHFRFLPVTWEYVSREIFRYDHLHTDQKFSYARRGGHLSFRLYGGVCSPWCLFLIGFVWSATSRPKFGSLPDHTNNWQNNWRISCVTI